jgi:uncharacterized protein (DUF927 family)
VHGGQEVRLVEISADAGAGLGAFENLHGAESGHAFSKQLTAAARRHYGTPLRPYLRYVIEHADEIKTAVRNCCESFVSEHVPAGASGEIPRVAERFALVGAAGEIATEAGITGWREGEAMDAAVRCFKAWLEARGSERASDDEAAIRQVRLFHRAARCEPLPADP